MTEDESTLPLGFYVRVVVKGPRCEVPGLGVLPGFAIIERETEEPIQYLAANSNFKFLVDQWDKMFGAWEAARDVRS